MITRSDGAKKTVSSFAGADTAYRGQSSTPARTYRFSVRAVNQAGSVAASATSPTVRPLTDKPSVVINSPANGATVSGDGTVTVTVTPNPRTRSPIDFVELFVDDLVGIARAEAAPWQLTWPTTWFNDGPHTLRVRVYDRAGKTTSVTRRVTIDNIAVTRELTAPSSASGP